MAIYHFTLKPISRAKGQSAVASAAYCTATRLYDERYGVIQDYTRKQGVEEVFTLAPVGAEWARDRERLWNAAEKAEVAKNATVAREYEIALPSELSAKERSTLAREFALHLVERYGVAVDVGMHAPDRHSDDRNWHVHMVTTTRTVGSGGLGPKTRILDAHATGPREVEHLRGRWADLVNQALERAQLQERVDHRSYKRQGIDRTPSTHLGHLVVNAERAALREQGLAPTRGMGIVEAMAQAGFEPVTERGRDAVMISIRNHIHHWAKTAEQTLSRTVDRAIGVAGPVMDRIASLFDQRAQPDLAAALGSPAVQRGIGDLARQDQADKAARTSQRAQGRDRDISQELGRRSLPKQDRDRGGPEM